eukprot:3028725-Prorocentrum_lima.AAC.1
MQHENLEKTTPIAKAKRKGSGCASWTERLQASTEASKASAGLGQTLWPVSYTHLTLPTICSV